MDRQQLYNLYLQETSMMVNPPSFNTWESDRNRASQEYEKLNYLADTGYENSTRGWTSDFE